MLLSFVPLLEKITQLVCFIDDQLKRDYSEHFSIDKKLSLINTSKLPTERSII